MQNLDYEKNNFTKIPTALKFVVASAKSPCHHFDSVEHISMSSEPPVLDAGEPCSKQSTF